VDHSQRTRVRAGDHDAFGVLFSDHARAVYNHAFRLTGNWSAAEEVVSLAFLEAWRLRATTWPGCCRCPRNGTCLRTGSRSSRST
jgi:DNA-directed RNA polymerase specialized sigma24 family protein